MSSEHSEPASEPAVAGEVPVEELARRQGVQPVTSLADWRQHVVTLPYSEQVAVR
jgi:hypothetical protein